MSDRLKISQCRVTKENLLRQPVFVRFRAFKGLAALDGSAVALFRLVSGAAIVPLASSDPNALFARGPLR